MQTTKTLLTADQLAHELGVRPGTVREWARRGRIPTVRLSPKVIRFELNEVVVAARGHARVTKREARVTTPQTPSPDQPLRLLLKSPDAAVALQISERKLSEEVKLRRIAVVRIGRSVRFDIDDLRAFINARKGSAS